MGLIHLFAVRWWTIWIGIKFNSRPIVSSCMDMRCDCQFNLLFLFCSIPSCILHLSIFRCSTIRIGVCGKCTQQTETSTKTIFIEYRARSYYIHSDVLRSLTHIAIKSDVCVSLCVYVFARVQNESESKCVYTDCLVGCVFLCLLRHTLSLSISFTSSFIRSLTTNTLIDLNEKHINKFFWI